MSFAPLHATLARKMAQSICYATLTKRPIAYNSAISLKTIYPNSSLKLTTPSFVSLKSHIINNIAE